MKYKAKSLKFLAIVITMICGASFSAAQSVDLAAIQKSFQIREKAFGNITLIYSELDSVKSIMTSLLISSDDNYIVRLSDSSNSRATSATLPNDDSLYIWKEGASKAYAFSNNTGWVSSARKPVYGNYPAHYRAYTTHLWGVLPIAEEFSKKAVKSRWFEQNGKPCLEVSTPNGDTGVICLYLDPERDWLLLGWKYLDGGKPLVECTASDFILLENGYWFPRKWECVSYEQRMMAKADPANKSNMISPKEIMKARELVDKDMGVLESCYVHYVSASAPPEIPIQFTFPEGAEVYDEAKGGHVLIGALKHKSKAPAGAMPNLLEQFAPGKSWGDFQKAAAPHVRRVVRKTQ